MLNNVIAELNELASLLEHNGKAAPAEKFRSIAKELVQGAAPMEDVLRELKSCGSIVQYANFSADEERKLFLGVFPAAEAALLALPGDAS